MFLFYLVRNQIFTDMQVRKYGFLNTRKSAKNAVQSHKYNFVLNTQTQIEQIR